MGANEIKKEIKRLANNYSNLAVIHYSCESFTNRQEGYSPRISSISVKHLYTEQVYSFSIHREAEIKHINKSSISQHYDELEKSMLNKLFSHIRENSTKIYIHWNMSSGSYGFEAIYHRAEVLGATPYKVAYGSTIPLASMLIKLYGSEYAPHPRLENIAKINNISIQDFVYGSDESKLFDTQDYNRLEMSNTRKTEIIGTLLDKTMQSKLKIKTPIFKRYIEDAQSHWLYQLCSIVLAIWGLVAILIELTKL